MSPTTAKNSSRSLSYMNSNLEDLTLNSASWSGNSVPYSYVISSSKIKESNTLDLIINTNTKELVQALSKYQLSGYKQEDSMLTIYAWGEKPSIDIPATLVVRGGL